MVWIGDRRTTMLGGLVLVLLGCCPQSLAHPQYTRRIRGQGLRHLQVYTTKSRKGSKGKNSVGSSGLLVSRPFFVEECSSSLLEDDIVDDDFVSQEEYAAYLYGLCASSLSFCTPPAIQTFANLVEALQISFVEGLCLSSPGVNECLQDLMDSGEPFGYDVSSDSTFEDVGLLDICNGIYDYFLSVGQIVVSMTAGPTTSPTNSPSESGPAGGQSGNLPSTIMPSNFTETMDPTTVEPSTDTVNPSTDTVNPTSTANPTMEESMEESIGSTITSSMTEEPMDSTAPVTTFSPTSPTESPTTTAPVPTTAPTTAAPTTAAPTTAAPTTAAPTTAAPTTAAPTTAAPTTASPTAADSPLAARGIGGDDENDSGGGDLPAGGIAGIALGAVAALAVLVALAKSKQPREEA